MHTLINAAFDFVHPEAEGRALAPPQRHHQRQHELHGPHDGDDVDATGARRPPSHALAPAPAPASPSARVPAPRPPPPQPGARAGRAPPPAGTQPPSQLPQSPSPRRAPAPDLSAPADALLHTREWRGFRAELRLLGHLKTEIALTEKQLLVVEVCLEILHPLNNVSADRHAVNLQNRADCIHGYDSSRSSYQCLFIGVFHEHEKAAGLVFVLVLSRCLPKVDIQI